MYFKTPIILLLLSLYTPVARGENHNADRIDKRYAILISGSWNSLNNGKLNDYFIYQLYPDGDKINSGYGLSSEFRYYVSHRISFSAGITFISGSSDLNTIIWDPLDPQGPDTVSVDYYIKTRLLAPTFSIRYHLNFERTDISIGIGESFLFGRASSNFTFFPPAYGSDTTEYNYGSTGMGITIIGAASYRFNSNISYFMETGFRKFATGDLVDNDKDLAMRYGYINDTGVVNLDYSGPYISAGLMYRLF